jgi:hypothetical protein
MSALAGLACVLELCLPPLRSMAEHLGAGGPWSALPLDELLVSLAAAALACSVAWLAAVTVAAVVEVVTGASSAALSAISPPVVRRAVLVCCGLAVGGAGLAAPAAAAAPRGEADQMSRPTSSAAAASALAGLPLPDRVPGAGVGQSVGGGPDVPAPAASVAEGSSYRVRPGESLWSIAEGLVPDAGVNALDAAWRRIYAVNRVTVGPDPDLLMPGTSLRLPGRFAGHAHERGNRDALAEHSSHHDRITDDGRDSS